MPVSDVLSRLRAELVLVDEVHNFDPTTRIGADASDAPRKRQGTAAGVGAACGLTCLVSGAIRPSRPAAASTQALRPKAAA